MAQALANAGLPLAAAPLADPSPDAQGWVTCGDLRVKGGTYGVDFVYTPGDVQYNGANYGTSDVVEVLTSTPLTFSDAADHGKDAPGATGIQVNPAVHADITLASVHIVHLMPFNLMTNANQDRANPTDPTRCHITLADGSDNVLMALQANRYNGAALRCGEGSVLVIDDSVRNTTEPNGNVHNQHNEVVPVNGFIGRSVTLSNGLHLSTGDPISRLDSENPGRLSVHGGYTAAGIGGTCAESAGVMTFNGGIIEAGTSQQGGPESAAAQYWTGAAIGGGNFGGGTGMTFNSGRIYAEAPTHGAAIGAGCHEPGQRHWGNWWPDAFNTADSDDRELVHATASAGDITINGGFIHAVADCHGNAFGDGCENALCSSVNTGHVLRVTGGTLVPDASKTTLPDWFFDLGLNGGHAIITGGSVRCATRGTDASGNDVYSFSGIGGTAWGNDACLADGYDPSDPADPNKVFKVTVNLSSEIAKRNAEAGITDDDLNDVIKTWSLTVGGQPYAYGAPTTFDEGKLYLWLPKSAIEKEISVELSYIDKNGTEQKIEPLFRDPGTDQGGDVLKRYIDFELPASYLDSLTKPYDGLGFETFDLASQKPPLTGLVTDNNGNRVSDGKELTDVSKVTYKYQPYDKRGGSPLGPEVTSDAAGNPLTSLSADVGVMKFTMDSSQWSDTEGFKDSYWGHRATGWCEITPVPSAVASVKAAWGDGSEVADPQDPAKVLDVEVDVTSGTFADGTPTAATCKAPEGRVQLYVDGEPAGEPVAIVLPGAVDDEGAPLTPNARIVKDADGREHTVVSWSFQAGDLMAPGARHTISARYLPLKNYLASDNPAEEDTPKSEVVVAPDPAIAPEPALSKKAENLTHPDGPTQPGDRIRYTVTATNAARGSLWTDVVISDPLPSCLELDEGSVRLTNAWEGLEGRPLARADAAAAGDVGKFSLSAPGADGRRVLSVPAGGVAEGSPATVTFECTVRGELDFSDPAAVDLENIASAEGKRPNPDDPDGPDAGPVAPPDTPPATPPGGGTVAPADPGAEDIRMSKAAVNLTRPDEGVTRIGDRLRYTVALENAGAADSCLMGAVISDPLPAGIEPVPGSIRLSVDGGKAVEVPDAAYDRASRTVAVAAGDLWGGHAAVLTFECVVGEGALGADNANVAFAFGELPSEGPARDPSAPGGPEPGEPAAPPADEDPKGQTPPASPAPVVPDDPAEGDIAVEKTAENLSRDDGTTRVGDTVRYTVTLRNGGAGTGWMDVVLKDEVPEGLEPVTGTLRLALPDGTEAGVSDAAYDPETRVLAVAVGHLYGGREAVLVFDALVTEGAVGADIGNIGEALGTLPSDWDPGAEGPEPGSPFDPPGGWDAFEDGRQKVTSAPAYPPGVDASGGVLPADDPGSLAAKKVATIRHKLAQTGDALLAAALLPAACALAAGAALLASRRRQRAAR
ncbi:hypothetical protein [uncultured Adlercreutzia sp.]|uniref:hypothetical protein n=1 Tax=uncultured Adlercreutzia sp. TaxID=875803 RepID=UPI0026773D52|nr:hypothetical protein [uncultured Adlercreutzia sp.]